MKKKLLVRRGSVIFAAVALVSATFAVGGAHAANCTQLQLEDCDTERRVERVDYTVQGATKGIWITTPWGKVGADKVSNPGFDFHLEGISYGSLATEINPTEPEYDCSAVDDPAAQTFDRLIQLTPEGGGSLEAILDAFWTETASNGTVKTLHRYPLHTYTNESGQLVWDPLTAGGTTLERARGSTLNFHICIS